MQDRTNVYSSASSDSMVEPVKKNSAKPNLYFERVKKQTDEDLNQQLAIERLSKNRMMRRKLINDYELPVSDRESWWRTTIKETPSPLKYKLPGFIKEMNQKPNTYRFKSDGRRRNPMPQQRSGEYALPGAYGYEDFAQRIKKLQSSYGFKDQEVHNLLASKNKSNPDLGPFTYETENYLTISNNKEPMKHSNFKSKKQRNIFEPKEGPSPGEYDEFKEQSRTEITSVFKSKSGRFVDKKDARTPGPGQYEPISAWINSKQTQDFNQKGQFFTPSAKVHT